ncbi:hypothetical protein B9T62_11770 [Paenibacillus donghaensis]|uniref:Uncharacterized protein n=1 Tax=Paenibacillus donghaensis TaxID=414771 RepID=A0A2Z2K870_9BACL|nr:hypothetical protein B9T62_11770 [Paenibacillus donghaensis]
MGHILIGVGYCVQLGHNSLYSRTSIIGSSRCSLYSFILKRSFYHGRNAQGLIIQIVQSQLALNSNPSE